VRHIKIIIFWFQVAVMICATMVNTQTRARTHTHRQTAFYCAALNAGRSSQEKAVCLFVCQTHAL